MATNFEVEGLKELEKALIGLGAELGVKTLRSAGREAMKPVLAAAQIGVHFDTGDTLESLAISAAKGKGDTAVVINVGATKRKASKKEGGRKFVGVNQKIIAQEFGTKKQKPDPFLRPALEQNADQVLSIFKTSLAKKIDQATKRLAKGAK